jgi:hypothetical protein
VEDVLSGVTAAAVELIPAAAEVGVLLITQNRKFETHAATSQHVHHLHVLRERFCNSSALQAALYGAPIVCTHDFQAERRWPKYSRAVVDLGDPQRHVGQAVHRWAHRRDAQPLPNPAHSTANPERSAQFLACMVPRRCRPAVNNSSPAGQPRCHRPNQRHSDGTVHR